jgi:maltose alpha-D-glucosyltransferase / alpha-amylase
VTFSPDPHWYRDAVIYQLHVRSFGDSDGDGIGDFKGLTERLDYISDLGVTAIWMLPFYPSPLRDDGYDIADYNGVNPSYGTLRDFRRFLKAAHDRGMRVITELVMNHTSDQHEWFQKARSSPPGSKWRDFYVWSDTAEEYRDARIIFQDFEASNWTWDPVAGAHYWHRFYSHQPDLNFENPEVRQAMFRTLDKWFEMGVDGVRLDAVPYLFEREGTNCENLPETHDFLKELRAHVDATWDDRMFLAEANQWPEDAAEYFGDGDECHMNFHFPVMPRLFMALRMEDRMPIVDILEQTPDLPDGCQWATFLRNHDELTLEMVTDEERDYMVRAYADDPQARINLGIRRRLAPLLENDRRKIELMNGLLFSLPGTPVVYYGDEIGMGDNFYLGDRDSVRTPMQWTADRNAGFSRANPQQLFLPPVIDPEYHYEKVNVEGQQRNPSSLLWWMRRLIALRKRHRVFGRGDLEFVDSDNPKVLAFTRSLRDEPGDPTDQVLVVANLSRHAQPVELDLRHLQGLAPVEMFGQTRFAPIGELPYYLTVAPFQFFWFALEPVLTPDRMPDEHVEPPVLVVDRDVHELFDRRRRHDLAGVVPGFITHRRWFAGKDRTVRDLKVVDVVPLAVGRRRPLAYLVRVEVDYVGADSEHYLLTLTDAQGDRASELATYRPDAVVARLERRSGGEAGLLIDAIADEAFCEALLSSIGRGREHPGSRGVTVVGSGGTRLRRLMAGTELEVKLIGAEQSNTSVVFGDQAVVKVIRKVEVGENPEVEIGRALDEAGFEATPAHLGHLEHRSPAGATTLAVVQRYVHNEGDAWTFVLDQLGRFYEQVITTDPDATPPLGPGERPLAAPVDVPDEVAELIGPTFAPIELLAQRTAELHRALAAVPGDAFAPEPFSTLYQRSLYQSFRGQTRATMSLVRRRLKSGRSSMADDVVADLELLLGEEGAVLDHFGQVRAHRLDTVRTRIHGDFHLGQVLWTGRDMVLIDFEGEPSRPIGERRIKRSPLVDVAGMLRSFRYATTVGLDMVVERGVASDDPDDRARMSRWGEVWRGWVEASYLSAYLGSIGSDSLVPSSEDDLRMLLGVYELEKALYELRYELQYRPTWVTIPLRSILGRLSGGGT